jgi:hypothetical protein
MYGCDPLFHVPVFAFELAARAGTERRRGRAIRESGRGGGRPAPVGALSRWSPTSMPTPRDRRPGEFRGAGSADGQRAWRRRSLPPQRCSSSKRRTGWTRRRRRFRNVQRDLPDWPWFVCATRRAGGGFVHPRAGTTIELAAGSRSDHRAVPPRHGRCADRAHALRAGRRSRPPFFVSSSRRHAGNEGCPRRLGRSDDRRSDRPSRSARSQMRSAGRRCSGSRSR